MIHKWREKFGIIYSEFCTRLFLLIMAALKRLVVKCMVGEAGEVLLHEPGVGVARQVVLDLFKWFFC